MKNIINKSILSFKGDKVKCTSKQLLLILEVVNKIQTKDSLIWICSDVNTNIWYINSFKKDSFLVNTFEEWENILGNDFQFTSGVFIWINKKKFSTLIKEDLDKLKTEDMEDLHIKESYIEIRAFDTSYFEIYSKDLDIVNKLILL